MKIKMLSIPGTPKEPKFLAVKDAKNDFGFDLNSAWIVVLIPNVTNKMLYVIGAMPIFCKAVKINFLEVNEEKNAFGFDSNKSLSVVLRCSRLANISSCKFSCDGNWMPFGLDRRP